MDPSEAHAPEPTELEDRVDQFNYRLTVWILLSCTSIVTYNQYVRNPIVCYIATRSGGRNLLEFVENYCWLRGIIQIDKEDVPEFTVDWQQYANRTGLFYQWLPFVLGCQTTLFYLPHLLWCLIATRNIQPLWLNFRNTLSLSEEERGSLVKNTVASLDQLLLKDSSRKSSRPRCRIWDCFSHLSPQSTRMFWKYLSIKVLYFFNSLGQIYIVNHYLADGYEGFYSGAHNATHHPELTFPRIGYCIVPVSQLGAVNHVTAQCILPINLLNERIYVFLRLWFILTVSINAVIVCAWIFKMTYRNPETHFITSYLRMNEAITEPDARLLSEFQKRIWLHDGLFILHLIANNAGELVCSEIVSKLWNIFKERAETLDEYDGNDGAGISQGSHGLEMSVE